MQNLKYFYGAAIITLLGLIGGYAIGGPKGAWIVLVLAVLETSLSFDNAVVNATVLKDMDAVWRKRFLVWGMLIAVFGMRLVFPIAIVAVIATMNPLDVIDLALFKPDDYAKALTSAHHEIAAFGGAFLMMVFLKYFIDSEKESHWLRFIESPLTKLGKMEAIEIAITLIAVILCAQGLGAEQLVFIEAGIWGVITFVAVDGFGALLGGEDGAANAGKQGFAGFMYLELLDASFSFDGVIGAFALSNNLLIIAIGLGVGAMFVRSFTLLLVDKGTLSEYRFLEHGAFWAIGTLAVLMFAGVHYEIPESVTGLIGAALIAASLLSSLGKEADHDD